MNTRFSSFVAAAVLALSASYASAQDASKPVPALLEELSKYQQGEAAIDKNLKTFDTLDFEVYSGQKWERLGESHDNDIVVHYPDGSTTKGLHDHIEALKPMFVFAPDTSIKEHPVRFGSGEWTGVIGFIEGTFTKPMPIGGGKEIAPTGKPFKMRMATIGHWTKDGVMDEEFLFWDNQDFMKQIGLGQ